MPERPPYIASVDLSRAVPAVKFRADEGSQDGPGKKALGCGGRLAARTGAAGDLRGCGGVGEATAMAPHPHQPGHLAGTARRPHLCRPPHRHIHLHWSTLDQLNGIAESLRLHGCPPTPHLQPPAVAPLCLPGRPPVQEQRTAGARRRGCWSSALDGDGGLDKPVSGAARDDAHHHYLESDDGRLRLQFWTGTTRWKPLPHGEDRR